MELKEKISEKYFLTDGGIETSLIFLDGFDLPSFAAFDLFRTPEGREGLKRYFRRYLELAKEFNSGFILESPTWRASSDWFNKLNYSTDAPGTVNRAAIELMQELKEEYAASISPLLISGCLGPRGDGYKAENMMTVREAEDYHMKQITAFARAGVDMVSAITMTYVEEALGIANTAGKTGVPSVISFTVETDGTLPSGMTLKEAVETVESNAVASPVYYMINCAHPTHFMKMLNKHRGEPWLDLIRGIRANASCKSHAELDESTELDIGNPDDLGKEYNEMKVLLKNLNIAGGCCGTDDRHIRQIALQMQ